MKKFIQWYREDKNTPPTFAGVLTFSNRALFWFAFALASALVLKLIELSNL